MAKKIPCFDLGAEPRPVTVLSVYDGDTFQVVAEIEGKPYRFPCRLHGIDTPELRGTKPALKQRAQLSRDQVQRLILDKTVLVSVVNAGVKREKYGRQLVRVTLSDGRDLAQTLIDHGHGLPYDGGTKTPQMEILKIVPKSVPLPYRTILPTPKGGTSSSELPPEPLPPYETLKEHHERRQKCILQ